MTSHIRWFYETNRPSYNSKLIHQSLIGKALFEHAHSDSFDSVAAVAVSSSKFFNSSLGPNLLSLVQVDPQTVPFFSKILITSSTLQFAHSMSFCFVTNIHFMTEGEALLHHLIHLTKYFGKSLTKLYLSHPSLWMMNTLSENLVALETLDLHGTIELLQSSNGSFVHDAWIRISKIPNLKHLTVNYGDYPVHPGGATQEFYNDGLKIVGEASSLICCRLETLLLRGGPLVSGVGIQGLFSASSPTNLKKFSLRHCAALRDDSLQVVAQSCPNLNYLDLAYTNFTPTGLQHLSNSPTMRDSLQHLDLESSTTLSSSQGIRIVASSFPMLRHLNLSSTYVADDDIKMLKDLSNLKRLLLGDCVSVTDESIKYITQSNFANSLEELNLDACEFITDDGMTYFTTDVDEKVPVSTLPNLKVLSLDSCFSITDEGLKSIGESFESLDSLILNSVFEITDDGVRNGICNLKNLKHVSFVNVDKLFSLHELKKKFPGIYVEC